jgi:hypothetical protein
MKPMKKHHLIRAGKEKKLLISIPTPMRKGLQSLNRFEEFGNA